jgi:hypothetical protein
MSITTTSCVANFAMKPRMEPSNLGSLQADRIEDRQEVFCLRTGLEHLLDPSGRHLPSDVVKGRRPPQRIIRISVFLTAASTRTQRTRRRAAIRLPSFAPIGPF